MSTNVAVSPTLSPKVYQRRIWAWTMYDWANSAFATTILAAVLPVYFSQVAGANLPSAAAATAIWGYGLSISLLLIAVLSPVLGTISDVMRGKKRFLAFFAAVGILGTALLVLVDTGDWVLASALAIVGRIGFSGANTFYDALLPHVARTEDQDRVSTRGYAMGYLGGGLLLAANIVMIQVLPGTWGARLSFVSVAVWWAIFSIPLFRWVPEPRAAGERLVEGANILKASFQRLAETLRDIRQYRELFKYLLAFLIYNDGIGTIIGVAAIYGAEMGFGAVELILALLLVQFVGIPYSLIFGRLPNPNEKRRPLYLAFILFNLVALPVVGLLGRQLLPPELSGAPPARFESTGDAAGEGVYLVQDPWFTFRGPWSEVIIPAEALDLPADQTYLMTSEAGAQLDFPFYGERVEVTFGEGPDHGIWAVELDGRPYIDPDTGQPLEWDGYHPTARYGETLLVDAQTPGRHVLSLTNTGQTNPSSQATVMAVGGLEVLPASRQSNLLLVIGMILAVELVGLLFAFLFGRALFSGLASLLTTKRSIFLALIIYSVIAVWGFFLNSVVEFWFLAWMVAIVQGGSQALSRSLYAGMSPASKSGEFFGLFGVMEKFSAIIGPLMFSFAATVFDSSRPAILSLIALFLIGGLLLLRVNIEEGRRVARQEDEAWLATGASG